MLNAQRLLDIATTRASKYMLARMMEGNCEEPTGELDAVKVARPVRGRGFGKVPSGNSLGSYPTVIAPIQCVYMLSLI